MKSLLKWLLVIIAAFAAVLLTIFLIFYLSPDLQKRVVLEELNSRPGVRAQADHIRFSFTGAEVRNFYLMAGADGASLESATFRLSPLRLLRGEISVREGEVRNLLIDLSEGGGEGFARAFGGPEAERQPGDPPPREPDSDRFEGILQASREAPRLSLRRLEMTGVLLLPDQVDFNLNAVFKDWSPGQRGTVRAELAGRSRGQVSPVSDGGALLEMEVLQARRGGLESLEGTLRVSGREREAPEAVALRSEFLIEPTPRGEQYVLRVFREGIEEGLAALDAEWQRADQRLAGELVLNIGREASEGLSAAAGLPVLMARGTARFVYAPFSGEGVLDLDMNATLAALDRVGGDLAPFEPLRVEALVSLFYDPAFVRVNELRTRVFQQGDIELFGAVALRPFEIRLEESDFGLGDLSGELMRIRFARIPLQIIDPILRGMEIRGTTLPADGVVSASQGVIRFRSEAPFGAEGVRLSENGVDLVEALDFRLQPDLQWSQDAFHLDLQNVEIRHRRGRVFAGTGRLSMPDPRDEVRGEFSVTGESDLQQLATIPLLGMQEQIRSGLGRVEASGSFAGESLDARGLLHIRDLRPAGYGGRPYGIRLEPAVSFAEQRLHLEAPVQLAGPTADTVGSFSLDATLPENGGFLEFNAAVDLDDLFVDDWQRLTVLLPDLAEPVDPVTDEPDTEAVFANLHGTAVARIGRVQYGDSEFRDVHAEVRIERGRQIDSEIRGSSAESPLAANAQVVFDPETPATPYRLTGQVDIRDLDVTPFLRAPGSRQPAILEGAFHVTGDFHALSPNLDVIADFLTGEFTLEASRPGTFRPLGERTGVADSVSGVIGAIAGGVRELRWVNLVVDQLKEIPYEDMIFTLARDPNLDIVLQGLDLVSRETRLRGQGRIEHREGVDLIRQPVDLTFQIFARGTLAEALREGGQLREGDADALGFRPGPMLPIRGSLADPESLFVNLMMESARALLPGLLRQRQ